MCASITTPRSGTPESTTLSVVGSRCRSKARIGTSERQARPPLQGVQEMARHVGTQQLLYGSDRPVVEPTPSGREGLLSENAQWLALRTGSAA